MSDSAIESISDGKIYIAVVSSLASSVGNGSGNRRNEVIDIFRKLRNIIERYPSLTYVRSENILNVLLVYTTPSSENIQYIAKLLKVFVEGDNDDDKNSLESFDYDLEEFANWISKETHTSISNEVSVQKTAFDILNDTNGQAYQLQSTVIDDSESTQNSDYRQETIFRFVQAKTFQASKYVNDVHSLSPLFQVAESYPPFIKWYNGLIKSYSYYWDNYGSLNGEHVSLNDFIRLGSFSNQFEALINPLNRNAYSDKLATGNWMSHVILPLIVYYKKDFTPLLNWLFSSKETKFEGSPSKKYVLWNKVIHSIIQFPGIEFQDFSEIIKYFLASSYYYAIFHEDSEKITSIEVIKIYDTIKDTLSLTSTEQEPLNIEIKFSEIPHSSSVNEFVNSEVNPLRPVFEPTGSSIATLNEIIETCRKLYPINKLTISKYLYLNRQDNNDPEDKAKEIRKIVANVNASNYTKLLESVRLFYGKFVGNHEEEQLKVKEIILERLLFSNLFDVVEELYATKEFKLPVNIYFEFVLEKFWESFNSASNLNDKIGKLKDATSCIRLFDGVTTDPELSKENKEQIIRIKHLLKAVNNIKNFRISVERNKPFTPYQLVNTFGNVGKFPDDEHSTPLDLVTLILEQNPKSFLAFEKLYKILNDLLLFFNDSEQKSDTHYFNRLKSACIESSLASNNFQFAYTQTMELFDHYIQSDTNLNDIWLTFYQVGKYVSPSWFDENPTAEEENEKIQILCKQREILSRTLQTLRPTESTSDNSKVIIKQWERVNEQIEEHYTDAEVAKASTFDHGNAQYDVTENIGALANDLLNDATTTTNNASEKLSNLFVSGLGWAIGANRN
ncbi:Sec39 domain-containing protein [Scheffersomyces xylosifermentans]|uniref:Sec39 domain-containing protein n=1 Tax=Scheffersomyces xylosifermentans TaxID=1304137 RepID=UPI00315CE64B